MTTTNHRITYLGDGDTMQARCSCHQISPVGDRGDVEAWNYHHINEVERIRTHLGTRTPTLKSQAAWFELQAQNTENPPDDRALWRQLAEETGRYLESKTALLPGSEPLF